MFEFVRFPQPNAHDTLVFDFLSLAVVPISSLPVESIDLDAHAENATTTSTNTGAAALTAGGLKRGSIWLVVCAVRQ